MKTIISGIVLIATGLYLMYIGHTGWGIFVLIMGVATLVNVGD